VIRRPLGIARTVAHRLARILASVGKSADLPGLEHHPHARAVLHPALPPDGVASHAYLFRGPAGTGKRTAARAFAAALLADGSPDPAGAAERVMRGCHPDLSWITPSGAAEMLVSDIDEPVVAAAGRTPFESKRRVFVIERAETMNEPTANRMLKTLEEPPAYAHLILLTDRPGELLETISSRCQDVRFDALPTAELAARLERDGVPAPESSRPPTVTGCGRPPSDSPPPRSPSASTTGRGPACSTCARPAASRSPPSSPIRPPPSSS
jgi:DNA polymerase-3 subunit delta'